MAAIKMKKWLTNALAAEDGVVATVEGVVVLASEVTVVPSVAEFWLLSQLTMVP